MSANMKSLGREAGQKWARNAIIRELSYAAELFEIPLDRYEGPNGPSFLLSERVLFADDTLGHYFQDLFIELKAYRLDLADRLELVRGWKEAVREFWLGVKPRIHGGQYETHESV